jgi:hypothetical protein
MTKKKASRTQKSTLEPPRLGGRTVPRGFIPYGGTTEKQGRKKEGSGQNKTMAAPIITH